MKPEETSFYVQFQSGSSKCYKKVFPFFVWCHNILKLEMFITLRLDELTGTAWESRALTNQMFPFAQEVDSQFPGGPLSSEPSLPAHVKQEPPSSVPPMPSKPDLKSQESMDVKSIKREMDEENSNQESCSGKNMGNSVSGDIKEEDGKSRFTRPT